MALIFALAFALLSAGSFSLAHAQAKSGKARTTLDVYVIDVEGGNAMLFVSPSGESLLMDTGNVGAGRRSRRRPHRGRRCMTPDSRRSII